MIDSLVDKRQFVGLDGCTWLYSGAETPSLKGGVDAMRRYMMNRSEGPAGRLRNAEVERNCKRLLAELLQGNEHQIAFLSNSSEVISMISNSLDLQPGENIVLNELEFPAGVLPFLLQRKKGVDIRVVKHRNWQIHVEDVMEQVDGNTRLVVASHVSYHTGARIDYKALYARLRASSNALLLLDATQSLGVVPVDVNHTDFLVCSSYKWLLSTHGAGVLAVNPDRVGAFTPRSVGWRSAANMFSRDRFTTFEFFEDARRFETGYPSYATLYVMEYSLKLLKDVTVESIEKHILDLGAYLIRELSLSGIEVMTPAERDRRAGNISIVCPEGEAVAERLMREKIYVWGGDGRVRASIHLFNDRSDVDRFLAGYLERRANKGSG